MNLNSLINVISGILFVLSGVAIIFGVKLLPPVSPKVLIGSVLIAVGVAVALGVPFKSAVVLAIAIIALVTSLSGSFSITVHRETTFVSGTLNCTKFKLTASMSSISLETGERGYYEGSVPVGSNVSKGCSMDLCCSSMKIGLKDPEELKLKNVMSSIKGEIRSCVKTLEIKNTMGTTRLTYDVPSNCTSEIELSSDMGTVVLTLKIPQNARVEYDLKASFGTALVVTPNGSSSSGSFGSGENVIKIRGRSSFGTVKIYLER
ncbi:hypothetical protein IPA_07525 [Ignicoccus pacificus DSM 13166]|uniref:Uncharacterized protein n=1 Tax=Ignicoccus pacificus DSM 13166 TaxID=940294 RepID=A0A977PLP1_9CREN|nr:hypothetical protein IPA_07525 [Ignicoccus pacificus DSM 13166]